MDGTLIEETSSWGTLHAHFGSQEAARKALDLYRQGGIDYQEFMRRDIAAWGRRLHIEEIDNLLSHFTLRSGAQQVVDQLNSRGLVTAIVTAGIRQLAQRVAAELGVQRVVANELQTDRGGFLTGEGVMRVDPLRKDRALLRLAHKEGITLTACLAVGDSEYDVAFVTAAGQGLILGDVQLARRAGVPCIQSLDEILDYV